MEGVKKFKFQIFYCSNYTYCLTMLILCGIHQSQQLIHEIFLSTCLKSLLPTKLSGDANK